MLLRVIKGTVVHRREADFASVCMRQVADRGRSPGLVAFIPGYQPLNGVDRFLLATTWESHEDAVREGGADGDLTAGAVLAGVANIDTVDTYTVIEPAFRGIVDAPGGVIRLTSGRVPNASRERMLGWLHNPTRERATSIQRLMLGWAVGERGSADGQSVEVIAASAWPSPLVIEAVADRSANDAPIYQEVDAFASDFHVEQYRALPLELPDAMADVGSQRLIAARFLVREQADATAAALPKVLTSTDDALVSVAPLGAPGTPSEVRTYVVVVRVAINEYARAERLIAELGGEVILSQREPIEANAGGTLSGFHSAPALSPDQSVA